MINVKSFFKQSSVYAISTFVSRAISLLLVPVYAKVLSPSDYGSIDIITVTCNLINLTIALEIHQAIARFYNDWPENLRSRYVSTAFYFSLLIYTAFILLMLPFRAPIANYFLEDPKKTTEITVALFLVWTSGIYYFTQSQLRWQMLIWNHAIVTITFTAVTATLTIYTVVLRSMGLSGVLYGLIGGNIAGIILALYFTRASYGAYFTNKRLREMLKFSSPLVLSGISVFLCLYVDRLMIKHYLNLSELGIFSIGSKFASIVGLLLVGINNALSPLIYKHYKDQQTPGQIEKIMSIYILGGLFMFLGLSLFSKDILIIFTTSQYTGAQYVIPFLVISTLFSAMYNFTPGVFIANKTKLIFYINIATAVINILLNALFIPYLGIIGSCIATVASAVINFLIYLHFNKKYYPIAFKWNAKIIAAMSTVGIVLIFSFIKIENMWLEFGIKSVVILLYMSIMYFYYYRPFIQDKNQAA